MFMLLHIYICSIPLFNSPQATNMISSRDLHSADKDTPAYLLTYRITAGPHQGYIEHQDDSGSAAFSFTQGRAGDILGEGII